MAYTIQIDKKQNFECQLYLEGTSLTNAKPRLILETGNSSYVFKGNVNASGNCVIPFTNVNKTLSGVTTGKMVLEVVAGNTIFTPYSDTFVIKGSTEPSINLTELIEPDQEVVDFTDFLKDLQANFNLLQNQTNQVLENQDGVTSDMIDSVGQQIQDLKNDIKTNSTNQQELNELKKKIDTLIQESSSTIHNTHVLAEQREEQYEDITTSIDTLSVKIEDLKESGNDVTTTQKIFEKIVKTNFGAMQEGVDDLCKQVDDIKREILNQQDNINTEELVTELTVKLETLNDSIATINDTQFEYKQDQQVSKKQLQDQVTIMQKDVNTISDYLKELSIPKQIEVNGVDADKLKLLDDANGLMNTTKTNVAEVSNVVSGWNAFDDGQRVDPNERASLDDLLNEMKQAPADENNVKEDIGGIVNKWNAFDKGGK